MIHKRYNTKKLLLFKICVISLWLHLSHSNDTVELIRRKALVRDLHIRVSSLYFTLPKWKDGRGTWAWRCWHEKHPTAPSAEVQWAARSAPTVSSTRFRKTISSGIRETELQDLPASNSVSGQSWHHGCSLPRAATQATTLQLWTAQVIVWGKPNHCKCTSLPEQLGKQGWKTFLLQGDINHRRIHSPGALLHSSSCFPPFDYLFF